MFDGLDYGHLQLDADRVQGADIGPGYVWDGSEAFAFGRGLDLGEGSEEVIESYREGGELRGGEGVREGGEEVVKGSDAAVSRGSCGCNITGGWWRGRSRVGHIGEGGGEGGELLVRNVEVHDGGVGVGVGL